MATKQLTRDDILLPVLAAWAHEEISIGRARELLHMPDDKIREEAEKRVSNAVKEAEYRSVLEDQRDNLAMMIRRLLAIFVGHFPGGLEIIDQARGLLDRYGLKSGPLHQDGKEGEK